MRKLNVAQAAKEAGQEYANLTPEQKEVRLTLTRTRERGSSPYRVQPYKQRSLVLKRAREQENEAYLRSLTPEDIKRENAFRTAQRKAGRSRKSNLKDLNAPKKPLSAYFMFLQHIRSDRRLVRNIFGDEQETTKQSVLAAAKWRSMTDEERKVMCWFVKRVTGSLTLALAVPGAGGAGETGIRGCAKAVRRRNAWSAQHDQFFHPARFAVGRAVSRHQI